MYLLTWTSGRFLSEHIHPVNWFNLALSVGIFLCQPRPQSPHNTALSLAIFSALQLLFSGLPHLLAMSPANWLVIESINSIIHLMRNVCTIVTRSVSTSIIFWLVSKLSFKPWLLLLFGYYLDCHLTPSEKGYFMYLISILIVQHLNYEFHILLFLWVSRLSL